MSEVLKVCVTGAAGQIAYSLLYSLAKGDVFGPDQKIDLVLLDIETMMGVLDGIVMELVDCAMPLLVGVKNSANAAEAFKDVSVAILVGAMPRREGMERKDLLKANVRIFKSQGEALDKVAKKDCKVIVVGNPANTNALICKKYAPSLKAKNFTCLTRLDHNRAMAQIGQKLGVNSQEVKNVIIWGNHSSTQFPDVSHATVGGKPVREAVNDDAWLKSKFIETVQTRGAAVIKARKLSSAMSAAKAICDHLRSWWFGTKGDEWVSMGVYSDGSYNTDKDLIYSFPCQIINKEWKIVQGLQLDDFAKEKMAITQKELKEERDSAMESCEDSK